MSIQFVYFDLGNILLAFDRQLACQNIAKLLDVDPKRADQVLHESGLQEKLEHGFVSNQEFAVQVCGELGVSHWLEESKKSALIASEQRINQVMDAISDMFTPVEEMENVLKRVTEKVGSIGILSNTCQAHWSWIDRQDYAVLQMPFAVTVLSFEVGSMKPDNPIYEVAESRSGVHPEQILFIDDREENIVAAKKRGWTAEHCLGGQSAIDALTKHGVL